MYNQLQSRGYTPDQINNLITNAVGPQTQADMSYLDTLQRIQDVSTGTMQDKQALANSLLSGGMTKDQVINAITNAVGQQTPEALNALFATPQKTTTGTTTVTPAFGTGAIPSSYQSYTGKTMQELFPSFAMSKQLAAQTIANRPTTQQIVDMIQGSLPVNNISAATFTTTK